MREISNNRILNVVNNDIDESDGDSSDSSDSSVESEPESSDSSDSSNSFSGDSSDDSEIDIGAINRNINRKTRKSIKISKKKLRRLLKKDKNKLKSNKYIYKLSRDILEAHPRWDILEPVVKEKFGLPKTNYWTVFKKANLAEIPFLLPCCVLIMIKKRAKVLQNINKTVQDLEAVEKFMNKALVHASGDTSAAAAQFICQIKRGETAKKAFDICKAHFEKYKTVQEEAGNNNNNIRNSRNKKFGQKICRDFNFGENGCNRPRCKFYSGHICCYCGYKGHGLRNCNSAPNMVIGRAPNLPTQPSHR